MENGRITKDEYIISKLLSEIGTLKRELHEVEFSFYLEKERADRAEKEVESLRSQSNFSEESDVTEKA